MTMLFHLPAQRHLQELRLSSDLANPLTRSQK
jgi:hypothetical protein